MNNEQEVKNLAGLLNFYLSSVISYLKGDKAMKRANIMSDFFRGDEYLASIGVNYKNIDLDSAITDLKFLIFITNKSHIKIHPSITNDAINGIFHYDYYDSEKKSSFLRHYNFNSGDFINGKAVKKINGCVYTVERKSNSDLSVTKEVTKPIISAHIKRAYSVETLLDSVRNGISHSSYTKKDADFIKKNFPERYEEFKDKEIYSFDCNGYGLYVTKDWLMEYIKIYYKNSYENSYRKSDYIFRCIGWPYKRNIANEDDLRDFVNCMKIDKIEYSLDKGVYHDNILNDNYRKIIQSFKKDVVSNKKITEEELRKKDEQNTLSIQQFYEKQGAKDVNISRVLTYNGNEELYDEVYSYLKKRLDLDDKFYTFEIKDQLGFIELLNRYSPGGMFKLANQAFSSELIGNYFYIIESTEYSYFDKELMDILVENYYKKIETCKNNVLMNRYMDRIRTLSRHLHNEKQLHEILDSLNEREYNEIVDDQMNKENEKYDIEENNLNYGHLMFKSTRIFPIYPNLVHIFTISSLYNSLVNSGFVESLQFCDKISTMPKEIKDKLKNIRINNFETNHSKINENKNDILNKRNLLRKLRHSIVHGLTSIDEDSISSDLEKMVIRFDLNESNIYIKATVADIMNLVNAMVMDIDTPIDFELKK